MPFESPDWPLGELLKDIRLGKVQLPDFQREWKWDDERIRSLLATISLGYPIGVVMTLETGGDGSRFKPKLVAGVDSPAASRAPEQLVLDGQQRLTSLSQSLMSASAVDTMDARGKRLRRWYYIDIERALGDESDREDAIIGVPEDRVLREDFGRVVRADYSSLPGECDAGMFPFRLAFDSDGTLDWAWAYTDGNEQRRTIWKAFKSSILDNITSYLIPVIKLTKQTPKEAVCMVFEKVNTGGVPLNVFELLTATYAGDPGYFRDHGADFRLKDYWADVHARLSRHQVLHDLESTDFLQAVTLLSTFSHRRRSSDSHTAAPGVSCKRESILALPLADFLTWAPQVTTALEWVAAFLAQEHIFAARDVPYRSQIVPLAAIRAAVGETASLHGRDSKLRRWFWCGVLGELYSGTTETRFARDLEQVLGWLDGGPEPGTVREAAFQEERLITLRTRNSAAYKGVYALLMRDGCRDWLKNHDLDRAAFFDYKIDIHHIFPKAWCDKNRVDPLRRESIINKTALSRETNLKIGGRSPASYVVTLEAVSGIDSDELDVILRGHAIEPAKLRAADFDGFFQARAQALLQLIETATGKPAIRTGSIPATDEDDPELFNAEPAETEADEAEATFGEPSANTRSSPWRSADDKLLAGTVYTRAELMDLFGINDATINTGVFRFGDRHEIWLFVTERKQPDRVQYKDQLVGDKLHWEGQSLGRTNEHIINHKSEGNDILVFYRKAKTEFPGAGFMLEGPFNYVSHSGAAPASFILKRAN
jgi:hypothetical protein